jgi:hypothetical protein
MNSTDDIGQAGLSKAKARRMLARVVGVLLGTIFSLTVVAGFWIAVGRERTPAVTAERLAEAMALWEQNGPSSYEIETELQTRQTEIHRVRVDGKVVVAYWRNGTEMKRRRTIDTWSVPGMFSTIQRDVENVERVKSGTADQTTPRLSIWGTFDPKYGYPDTYRRVQLGADSAVSWKVLKFSP